MTATVTYPVTRRRELVRTTATRRCPVCGGHGWVSQDVTVRSSEGVEVYPVSLPCYWCHETGRVEVTE